MKYLDVSERLFKDFRRIDSVINESIVNSNCVIQVIIICDFTKIKSIFCGIEKRGQRIRLSSVITIQELQCNLKTQIQTEKTDL